MGMSTGGGGGRPKSEPNVTPYIDILLVLLIIFMVITPFTPRGLDVRVPQKVEGDNLPADLNQGIVISIDKNNTPFINKEAVTFESLGPKLTQIYNARADKSVFVKGEKSLIYGDVVKAIDIAKGAGCTEIGLMTELDVQ